MLEFETDGEFPTFSDALGQLREEGQLDRLEMITIHGQVVEPQFQQELVEALETHASREFAEARDSAGNMHNPKLEALNAVLDEIVLGLPTVQNLNVELGRVGRQISHASHEKLTLFDRDGELLIFFGLWLSVEAS